MNSTNGKQHLRRVSRRRLSPDQSLTEKWIVPNIEDMSEEDKKRYNSYASAIKDYISGCPVSYIKSAYKINISHLQSQIWRAIELDDDGIPFGFRALIPNLHVKKLRRTKDLPVGSEATCGDCAGAFKKLMDKEDLWGWLESRVLKLGPGPHPAKITALELQKELTKILTERGYLRTDYPFNTNRPAYSSIGRAIKQIKSNNFKEGVLAGSNEVAKTNFDVMSGKSKFFKGRRPFEEVECDEHKLHGIAGVNIIIDGVLKTIPTPRAVGIVIIDKFTGIPLGATVHLGIEASESALIAAIRSAIVDEPVMLPNGEPAPSFRASDYLPEVKGAVWDVMHLDNAKIHVSNAYFEAEKRLGCQTCFGPLRSWSARPNIESTFGNLVNQYFSATPSFTGAGSSHDGRSQPAQEAGNWYIDLPVLCKLFYSSLGAITLANSAGTLYERRIDVIQNYVHGPTRPILRRLPPPTANTPEIGTSIEYATVKRRSEQNPNFYINRNGKYTNQILAKRADLLGEKIIVHISPNVRTLSAFLRNGKPLGELIADGVWGGFDHTSELRKAIEKDKDKKFGHYGEKATVAQSFLEDLGRRVLNEAEKKKNGKVVDAGLKLARYMEAAKVPVLDIESKKYEEEKSKEQGNQKSSAIERARLARKALENMRRSRNE
ncbi:hypothetical protein GTP46_05765 [Duganella sp. FT135W]|uniref:Integrase catalytic domain-containing protein n=1 Tax=Duganella flavida TaxID=2692175 RepID=A0A6L8K3R2_9BURK|nr:hypothetical protein [Duganella flavida]MYM22149.1 hypothetical protein [Duganella flavida]